MRMNARRAIACAAAVLLLLIGSARATRIMVVSDIHYMDKSLCEGSELFLRILRAGDGKISQHSAALMSALAAEAADLRPDALIVTGDLAFNGERASHLGLARWFSSIEALGIPVWVMPGNHDINCAAHGFSGDAWYDAEAVTPEAFSAIYADFMLPAEGEAGLSYLARIDGNLSVAMTDVACYQETAQSFGVFMAGHADWLEDAARRNDSRVLVTATHHGLIPHTAFMQDTFVMFGGDAMLAAMRENGIRLNLSGHIHAQHIAERDGIADAATGAFCNWPHRYALLTVQGDSVEYRAEALNEAHLPQGFMAMSREWFADIARDKARASLEGNADAEAMADYAARFNLAYFSGTYRSDDPSWRSDPAFSLWQRHGDNAFWQYMNMVMNEASGNHLRYGFAVNAPVRAEEAMGGDRIVP